MKITKEQVLEVCRVLGVNPDTTARIEITPRRYVIECLTDEIGHKKTYSGPIVTALRAAERA